MKEGYKLPICIILIILTVIIGYYQSITQDVLTQDVPTMKQCAEAFPCNPFQLGLCDGGDADIIDEFIQLHPDVCDDICSRWHR